MTDANRTRRVIASGLGMLLGLSAAAPVAPDHTLAVPATSARLLTTHNLERARVGVGPLQWDQTLAAAAASYGPALERLGGLHHSPRASRPGQRENLGMGTRGAFAPEQMVSSWIAENQDFRPGVFPHNSRTGNWIDVSHYTQLVWRDTTHVGCAIHSTARWDFLICRYSPPGNVDGKTVY